MKMLRRLVRKAFGELLLLRKLAINLPERKLKGERMRWVLAGGAKWRYREGRMSDRCPKEQEMEGREVGIKKVRKKEGEIEKWKEDKENSMSLSL